MNYLLWLSVCILFVVSACHHTNPQAEQLAQKHCGSCHQFPSPSLLSRDMWEYMVLPQMAIQMGVRSEIAKINRGKAIDLDFSVESPVPLISDTDWFAIKKYYLDEAPSSLPKIDRNPPPKNLSENKFQVISARIVGNEMPNLTCVKIDPKNQLIHACDEINHQWVVFGNNGQPIATFANQNAVTNISFANATNDELLVTYTGKTVKVVKEKEGVATLFGLKNQKKTDVLRGLYRPMQVISADLDHNKTPEYITCEYGYTQGGFSVWQKNAKGQYQAKTLSATPGATQTMAIDWDKDGLTDLITLFAQADERIVWYKNKGGLTFEEKTLLRFPPVYGSSSFELADMNADGQLDIVYTCGDNADFSQMLKPYHGVYVFQNEGNNVFKQSFFYPMHGAYKAISADFDKDGDLDLVAIAFFSDNGDTNKQDGFVYLENNNQTLVPYTLPISDLGRWIVMDVADADGDGDADVVLGSHPVSPSAGGFRKGWEQGPGCLILKNISRK